MKRFLIIFAICFASIIGIFGGVYGIKYLKGDFNEVPIPPETIAFELEEYDVTDDFKIKITTQTENVNKTLVTLTFAKGTSYNTYGKDYITDGVIIIPKQVTLNVSFDVRLFKATDTELSEEVGSNVEWIKGGISNLVATSENTTTPKATTKVCVDVPVYKTEIVIFGGESDVQTTQNYSDVLSYIEGQKSLTKTSPISFNAGDTFYLGLKFYPARSAYKYSKISSSNLLVEYKEQIEQKLAELNLDYSVQFNQLSKLFVGDGETVKVGFDELMSAYGQIINLTNEKDTSALGQFTSYLNELNNQFKSNLKFYAVEENAINEKTYTNKIGVVDGTNLYKFQATTDSTSFSSKVDISLYSYAFVNSEIENQTLNSVADYNSLLITLENLFGQQQESNKKVYKAGVALSIVDVDVDTVEIKGQMENFKTNSIHTIYASKSGVSNTNNSYLDVVLSNSNIPQVDLQNKILNLGIRFEKRLSSNTWGSAEEDIKFVDEQNYTKVVCDGYTYYLPIGNLTNYTNSYWQIYADKYAENDFRAVLAYIGTYETKDGINEAQIENVKVVADNPIFRLNNAYESEQMVKWASLDALQLGIVDIEGVVDFSIDQDTNGKDATTNVSYNSEIDLSTLIQIPQGNFFQTYKFFIYSDGEDTNKLSKYFYTKELSSKPYIFNGITKNLYELDGTILKLKGNDIPTYSVNVIFMTIATSAMKNPIYNEDGTYQYAKFSATKDSENSVIENLSALMVSFAQSLNQINVITSNVDSNFAGIVIDNQNKDVLKVAQNATDVIKLKIDATGQTLAKIKDLILSDEIKLVAKESKSGLANYISYRIEQDADSCYFVVSTQHITKDTVVKLYFVYTVSGNDYLFQIPISFNASTFYTVTIIENTTSSAQFNFTNALNGDAIDLSLAQKIEITTTYTEENGFGKTYTAIFNDNTKQEINIFNNDNVVKVKTIDFLGNEITDDLSKWYLTSSNTAVAIIQNDNYINFVGSLGDVEIALYVKDASGDIKQQSIKFGIVNNGYVSKVTTKGDVEQVVYNNDSGTYNFAKLNVTLTRQKGDAVDVDKILEMIYKIDGVTQNDGVDLAFTISVLDSSKSVLQEISGNEELTDNRFTLLKCLGSVVSVDFKFVFLPLGITQEVSLKLVQTLTISNLVVNEGTNEVQLSNSSYPIYTGIQYTINFNINGLSSGTSIYVYNEQTVAYNKLIVAEDNTSNYILILNDSFISKKCKLHITTSLIDEDNSLDVKTGDLDYILDFTVTSNIKIDKNNQTLVLKSNIGSIEFNTIFARVYSDFATNELTLSNESTGITFQYDNSYANNGKINSIEYLIDKTIKITFNSFTDNIKIVFSVVLDNVLTLGPIYIEILPENLKDDDATNFALYDATKAIVLTNGDAFADNTISKLFKTGTSIYVDSAFESTYVAVNGESKKIVTSSSTLFTDTKCIVTVTKDGISTTYKIIISRLAFPFVNFYQSDAPISYSGLDIYKLFVSTDGLYQYYEDNNIFFNTTTLQNDIFNLQQNQVNPSAIGTVQMATGDGIATNYAELTYNNDTKEVALTVHKIGVIGGVYVKVSLNVAKNDTSTYFSIPVILHLNQSQRLDVYYPNSEENITYSNSDQNTYGNDGYDAILKQTYTTFENAKMEYLKFAESGKATLDLVGGKFSRFNVYELVDSDYTENKEYTGGFTFAIDKVVINQSGQWSDVAQNAFANYAYTETNDDITRLVISKYGGADIVRVKIKITTNGGAVNYYYVSAGEVEEFSLMRQDGTNALSIGATDVINLSSNDILIIGSGENTYNSTEHKYYYYLSNSEYNSKLKFRITDADGNLLEDSLKDKYVTLSDNLIKINVSPIGSDFKIEIYTIYGVLCTISVTVEKAYTITLKDGNNEFYSGSEYDVTEVLTVNSNVSGLGASISQVESTDTDTLYLCTGTKISFAHISTQQTLNLSLKITVDGNDVTVSFGIKLLPRIQTDYSKSPYVDKESDPSLTTCTVNENNEISIDNKIIEKLFVDNYRSDNKFIVTDFSDLKLYVKVGNSTAQEWNSLNSPYILKLQNAITSTTLTLINFVISYNDTELLLATAMFTVNSYYKVTLNYPIVLNGTTETILGREYVKVGSVVDFVNGKNINNLSRINIVKSGDLSASVAYKIVYEDAELTSYTFDLEGEYSFDIKIGSVVYAKYLVTAISQSPITFTSNINNVYVSYGDNDIFGNVDVVITLPNSSQYENLTGSLAYKKPNEIGYKSFGNTANVYYQSGQKIRNFISIADYVDGIEVFFKYNEEYIKCDATFTPRCNLKYYNYDVRYTDYENFLVKVELKKDDYIKEQPIQVQVSTNLTVVPAGTLLASDVDINYIYDIIVEDTYSSAETPLTLNANEITNGYSFVNLFKIKDVLGNVFGINNVSDSKTIGLTLQNSVGAINCLPIDPQVYDSLTYDYTLKPVGASNEGTLVKLTFVYGYSDYEKFTKDFYIKVVSDVEFEVYNNDGTATSNSEYNPLKVVYSQNSKILLSSDTQTKYIYAYSKYSTLDPKPNLVQKWEDPQVAGDVDYIKVIKENGALYLQFVNEATFGDKSIVVSFVDPYNFTIKYYITLIASISVSAISVDSGKMFEGDTIDVYNKNIDNLENTNNPKGIAITLLKENGNLDTETKFNITNVSFRYSNGASYSDSKYNIIKSQYGGLTDSTITFNFLSQDDIWNNTNLSNGLSLKGTLSITITKANDLSESFTFDIQSFTLYKKYYASISPENTYVRENIPINLANFIDVYDYKQEAYLGKPTLTAFEEVYYEFDIKDIKLGEGTQNTLLQKVKDQLKTINDNKDYETTSDSELKKTKETNYNNAITELQKLGIVLKTTPDGSNDYTVENFTIFIRIKAKHKTTSIITNKELNFDLVGSYTDTELTGAKFKARVELGDTNSLFGSGIDLENYNFEYWLYNIKESLEVSNGKIATTKDEDVTNNIESATYIVYKLTTGSLYHISITNSENLTGNVSLALKVEDEAGNSNICLINNCYGNNLSAGKQNFYLYDEYYNVTESSSLELQFEGKKVSLFTGKYDSIDYVNGLSLEDVKLSKNIINATDTDVDNLQLSVTPTLNAEISLSGPSDKYNVYYQEISKNKMLVYSEFNAPESASNPYATETRDFSLYVTPTYIGVDTSNAYVSSIHYCYTQNFEVDENGYLTGGEKDISLQNWAQGFKLIPGVGLSAILAQSDDLTLYGSNTVNDVEIENTQYLKFKAGNVMSLSGQTTSSSFTINESSGNISLTVNQFKPNDYYISVDIYCIYASTEEIKIATLYLAFVDVDNVDIYKQTDGKYSLDISNYTQGQSEISVSDVKMGLANVESLDGNIVTFNDTGLNLIQNNKIYLLQVGSVSQYVKLRVNELILPETIALTKSGNTYSFSLSDLTYNYDGIKTIFAKNQIICIDVDKEYYYFTINETATQAIISDVVITLNSNTDTLYFVSFNGCTAKCKLSIV